MNVPAMGSPKPTVSAKLLMLNRLIDVVGVTVVCDSNPGGWLNNRNM